MIERPWTLLFKILSEYGSRPIGMAYVPYPSPDDPGFNEIICKKYELNRFFGAGSTATRSKQSCTSAAPAGFELKPYQRALAAYMSPKTPYSGLLLYHATGTGKTCTAITIARQFAYTFTKPPLVIFPSTLLEGNFEKEVQWCSSKTASIDDALGWEFRGAIEFANMVKRLEDESGGNKGLMDELIKESFSDRIIIVDEAHNLRSNEADKKQVPPKLKKVLRSAKNTKLILMTATPMFDVAREIVFLINLLLANDNRVEIKESDVFDTNNNLKPNGADVLAKASVGYVSFQQVSNEKEGTFPSRLYPNKRLFGADKAPKYDIYGKLVAKEDALQAERLKSIVCSRMQGRQLYVYQSIANRMLENETNDKKQTVFESENANNVYARLRMAANVAFPSPGIDPSVANQIKYITGIGGFNRCFQYTSDGKILYRANVPPFLSPALLPQHACKIDAILKCVERSEGVVLIHSTFVVCGLLPVALALEHLGYERYGGNPLLKVTSQTGPKRRSRYKYALWTGQTKLSPNKDDEIKIAKSPENARGDVIRVILASDVATEGIDLKCIREVHILDPWYNHSKMHQVFGRAIRHCSHASLPPNMRNVTIYQHASVDAESDKESVDWRTYRVAYSKQTKIDRVSVILRNSAMDALLHDSTHMAKLNKSSSMTADRSTFDIYFAATDIEQCGTRIKDSFKSVITSTYSEILSRCMPIDEEIFIWSLQRVLDDPSPTQVYSEIANQWGRIVYVSNKYIFQPSSSTDPRLTFEAREGKTSPATLMRMQATVKNARGQAESHSEQRYRHNVADVESRALELLAALRCNPAQYKDVAIDYVLDRLKFDDQLALLLASPTNVNVLNMPHVLSNNNQGSSMSLHIINFERNKPSERYLKWRSSKGTFEPSAIDERMVRLAENEMQKRIVHHRLKDALGFVTSDAKRIFKMISSKKHLTGGVLTGTSCETTSTIKKLDLKKLIAEYDVNAASVLDPSKNGKTEYCIMYELVLRKFTPDKLLRPFEHHLAKNT